MKQGKLISRSENAFPFLSVPLKKRLKLSKSISLKDNFVVVPEGNGYGKIVEKNKNKNK